MDVFNLKANTANRLSGAPEELSEESSEKIAENPTGEMTEAAARALPDVLFSTSTVSATSSVQLPFVAVVESTVSASEPASGPASGPVPLRRSFADQLGICLSALCVVHCILTPILVIALPSLQLLEMHEVVHESLLVILPILAVLAFIPGFRRHRDRRVFLWSAPGFAFLALAIFAFDHESWMSPAVSIVGSFFLIRAHLINRRLCACCEMGHRPSGAPRTRGQRLQLHELRAAKQKRQRLLSPLR